MATRVLAPRVLSPAGDLTDSYRDASVQSTSPLRTRHGRGDTPLSLRPASSLSSASATSSRRAPLPSLDKLIAFLDDDDDDDAPPPSTSTPPRPAASRSPPPAPLHTHSRSVRLSPAPALELIPPDDSTRETAITASEQSPSARTEQSRRERSFRDDDAVGRAQGKGAERRLERERGPEDSPSPKPGSVAELRERTLRLSANRQLPPQTGTAHERPPSPADSVSRIADEVRSLRPFCRSRTDAGNTTRQVLDEFDSIISRHSSPASRPRSRLRHIPSPPLSSSPPQPSPPPPTQQRKHNSSEYEAEAADEDEDEDEDDTRTKAWVDRHPSVPGLHHSSAPNPTAEGTLVDELREAKAYIAQLHAELREIASVVGSLRGPPYVLQNKGREMSAR